MGGTGCLPGAHLSTDNPKNATIEDRTGCWESRGGSGHWGGGGGVREGGLPKTGGEVGVWKARGPGPARVEQTRRRGVQEPQQRTARGKEAREGFR